MITKFNYTTLYYEYMIQVFLLSVLNTYLFKTPAFNNFCFDIFSFTGIKHSSVIIVDSFDFISIMNVGLFMCMITAKNIEVFLNRYCCKKFIIKISLKNNIKSLFYGCNRVDASNPFLYNCKCCGLLE